jgi:hypothetical protein
LQKNIPAIRGFPAAEYDRWIQRTPMQALPCRSGALYGCGQKVSRRGRFAEHITLNQRLAFAEITCFAPQLSASRRHGSAHVRRFSLVNALIDVEVRAEVNAGRRTSEEGLAGRGRTLFVCSGNAANRCQRSWQFGTS